MLFPLLQQVILFGEDGKSFPPCSKSNIDIRESFGELEVIKTLDLHGRVPTAIFRSLKVPLVILSIGRRKIFSISTFNQNLPKNSYNCDVVRVLTNLYLLLEPPFL